MFKFLKFFKKQKNILFRISEPFTLNNGVIYKNKKYYKISDINKEILDFIDSDKFVFSKYDGILRDNDSFLFENMKIKNSLIMLKPLFIGREYSKTCSFLNEFQEEPKTCILEILSGKGYILLENLNNKKLKLIKVSKKSIIYVPKNYTFTIINRTSDLNLILEIFSDSNSEFKESLYQKNNGNSIFYTKNGFVKNKNVLANYNLEEYDKYYLEDFNFNQNDKTLYEQFLDLPEKFDFLKE